MIKAYAKVNLSLKVTKLRSDGYHDLEMINARINLFDKIKIKEYKKNIIKYKNLNIILKEDTILNAIELFQEKFNIPKQKIIIKKKIPVGSGLGGVSADIASIILYLNKKYKINKTINELIEMYKYIGSDICYCFYKTPAKVLGIGDIIEPCNIEQESIILINPNIIINTKKVFENLNSSDFNKSPNDLQNTVRRINQPMNALIEILENLNIGKFQITGSGSSIIVFKTDKLVKKVLKHHLMCYNIKEYKILK